MNLASILIKACAAAIVIASSHAQAYQASLSLGRFEPIDGVVNGLYNTNSLAYMAQFSLPRDDGLSWSNYFLYYDFESRVANLENEIELIVLNSGFRKSFLNNRSDKRFGVEPFFGASAGAAILLIEVENEDTEQTLGSKDLSSFAVTWEIGAVITEVFSKVNLEMKITDITIGRKVFGNVNIGGKVFSLGLGYTFGQ